jgi:hypothetical protein
MLVAVGVVEMAGLALAALEEVAQVHKVVEQLAQVEQQIRAVAVAVLEVLQPHLEVAVQALLSFVIQLHTLMQLHTHLPLKQHQMGIRFIPFLPLEQSPSKE